jgi:hypothetical protein
MDELASRSIFSHITNVTIERRHKCLTVGGEEEGRYGCNVGVINRGIPHGGAYPPTGGAHGSGQYPWPECGEGVLELWPGWPAGDGGGLYSVGGSCGGHVEVCSTVGDLSHDITDVGPIREPCSMKV